MIEDNNRMLQATGSSEIDIDEKDKKQYSILDSRECLSLNARYN